MPHLVCLVTAALSLRPSLQSLRAAQQRLANGLDKRSEAALAPAIRASPRPWQEDSPAVESPDTRRPQAGGMRADPVPWFEQSPEPPPDASNEVARSLLPRRRSAAERAAEWLIQRYEAVYGEPYDARRKDQASSKTNS